MLSQCCLLVCLGQAGLNSIYFRKQERVIFQVRVTMSRLGKEPTNNRE